MAEIGTPVRRREDYRFLTGQGTYTVNSQHIAGKLNGLMIADLQFNAVRLGSCF